MKIKTDYGTFDVLPCPCCGKNKLIIGVQAAWEMGVRCSRYIGGCGLQINVGFPEKLKAYAYERC